MSMRIVSLINPYPCGAYQVHLDLMYGLERRGCSLTWLSSGSLAAQFYLADQRGLQAAHRILTEIDGSAD